VILLLVVPSVHLFEGKHGAPGDIDSLAAAAFTVREIHDHELLAECLRADRPRDPLRGKLPSAQTRQCCACLIIDAEQNVIVVARTAECRRHD
jgi:hypothetical protein